MSEPDSERASRQELVVPPRQSSLPVILGACICGCLGFGLVWGLGIGRAGRPPLESAAIEPTAVDSAEVTAPDGWRHPAVDPEEQPETDRYPEKPVSYQRVEELGGGGPRDLSRFSLTTPPDPQGDAVRATSFRPDDPAAEPASPAEPGSPAELAPPAELVAENPLPLESTPEPNDELTAPLPQDAAAVPPVPSSTVPQSEPEPEPRASAGPTSPPAFQPTTDLDGPPNAGEAAAQPAAPAASALAATAATVPVMPPPSQGTTGATAPLGFTPQALSGAPSPSPFPPQLAPADRTPPREPDPLAAVSGQGRPGPSQLEGVQAPHITVEKRGPREVQVGKKARYEMAIRNVGTATAHAVMLHDTVPAGTRLMATTPPAAPAADDPGGLVWMLGTLEPGAGTKVAMEVMPDAEGEIGSVASVTFRADATARSRSTRPGLQVDASPPEAVLIGREITASIAVSNPGTGVSTGVVLVGTLPEGVTHPAGREVEFDVGRLEPGERKTIDLTLATTSPGVHAMTILARADGQLNAEAAVPLEVTAPMLELAADMPGRRYLQRPAACLITMHNTGTAPAKAVELATQLPPGLKFVRANNAGFYDERHHRVLWSLEELPAGETGTVELVVMPVDLGPQKLVTAARNPAGLSDQIANTIEVDGLASLTFLVTDSEDPIEVGGMSEYVIRVGNQGTKPASGVRVAATLLGDLEPVDAKGPAGHRIENLTVLFEPLAKLVPTEEATYRVRVRGRRAGDHRVQVQVTSDDHQAPITKEEVTRVYADR